MLCTFSNTKYKEGDIYASISTKNYNLTSIEKSKWRGQIIISVPDGYTTDSILVKYFKQLAFAVHIDVSNYPYELPVIKIKPSESTIKGMAGGDEHKETEQEQNQEKVEGEENKDEEESEWEETKNENEEGKTLLELKAIEAHEAFLLNWSLYDSSTRQVNLKGINFETEICITEIDKQLYENNLNEEITKNED